MQNSSFGWWKIAKEALAKMAKDEERIANDDLEKLIPNFLGVQTRKVQKN